MQTKHILLIITSLVYSLTFSQVNDFETKFTLANTLQETSGLIYFNDKLISHTDSYGNAELYEFSTTSDSITRTIQISNATNVDWEDIAQDEQYIYIGDFGNNYGTRTDLKIYRISKADYTNNDTVIAEIISFSYNDQINFTSNNNTNFDCEGFIIHNDEILLFSKNYGDKKTSLYTMPKSIGVHTATNIATYNVQGLITGATFDEDLSQIFLTGYSSTLVPFIMYLGDYTGNSVFEGIIEKTNILSSGFQIEGIAHIGNNEYYISNEKFVYSTVTVEQQLHKFNSAYINCQKYIYTNIIGNGVLSVDDSTAFDYGTTVSITAIADEGWEFDEWTGDVNSSMNPINLLMNQDVNLTAVFKQIEHQLTVISTNGNIELQNGVLINNSATYFQGESETILATPINGFTFVKFEIVDSEKTDISYDNLIEITIEKDVRITAFFEKTTGIESLNYSNFSIFPNPAINIINVNTDLKYDNIEILNLVGQIVLESDSKEISISNLKKGIYYVSINTAKGNVVGEFVKE